MHNYIVCGSWSSEVDIRMDGTHAAVKEQIEDAMRCDLDSLTERNSDEVSIFQDRVQIYYPKALIIDVLLNYTKNVQISAKSKFCKRTLPTPPIPPLLFRILCLGSLPQTCPVWTHHSSPSNFQSQRLLLLDMGAATRPRNQWLSRNLDNNHQSLPSQEQPELELCYPLALLANRPKMPSSTNPRRRRAAATEMRSGPV